jgi:ferritin-like metal-binding protein YciE
MSSKQEIVAQWLRDAHAAEEQAKTMLGAQISRVETYPELKARLEQHRTETEGQERKLYERLRALGSDPSTVKDLGGKTTAMLQGIGGSVAADEVVKGAIAGYAFENFEIASYRALIGAAEAAGDTETKRVAEEILVEEEAMAAWLEENLPKITAEYLDREERGETSKR